MSDEVGEPPRSAALVALGLSERVVALASDSDVDAGSELGRVIGVTRINCTVATDAGECGTVGHPLPVVGDWVLVARAAPDEPAQVTQILPRWSTLERHGAAGATEVQVLAVNIDLVFIVISLDGLLRGSRLDRELVVAWESGAQPVVVLTKADQHADPQSAVAEAVDRSNGVRVILTSAVDGRGIDEVREIIGPTDSVVLLGASGVGKSTLANRLLGSDVMATGGVRTGDRKGRHTTTTRDLVPIPGGGVLIDTPGLRGLGLWDVADGMSLAFSDIEELAEGCRFNDCMHDQEPACAVRAAVAEGSLSVARFESWRKLQLEAANVERQREARSRLDESRSGRRRRKRR